jgi:hypothetical protein
MRSLAVLKGFHKKIHPDKQGWIFFCLERKGQRKFENLEIWKFEGSVNRQLPTANRQPPTANYLTETGTFSLSQLSAKPLSNSLSEMV